MTSYDTMASALRETGLYALSGETLVDAELAAYAAALDVLCERLKALQKDSFLCTAGEEGLSRWEALFGLQIQGSLEYLRRFFKIVAIGWNRSRDFGGPGGAAAVLQLHRLGEHRSARKCGRLPEALFARAFGCHTGFPGPFLEYY